MDADAALVADVVAKVKATEKIKRKSLKKPPRVAFNKVVESRVVDGKHLEVLLKHCETGEEKWTDMRKCRNYSRTMFQEHFKDKTGEKDILYRAWRRQVNKTRRDAFAAAKGRIPKGDEDLADTEGDDADNDMHRNRQPTEVKEDEEMPTVHVVTARSAPETPVITKAVASPKKRKENPPPVTPAPVPRWDNHVLSDSESEGEPIHPGLLHKRDPLLQDAYYGIGRYATHPSCNPSNSLSNRNREGRLISINSAFSTFSGASSSVHDDIDYSEPITYRYDSFTATMLD